jgi:hypothetical protein
MTDEQIIAALKSGEVVNFGMNGRNVEVMRLMADLEKRGLITTWDASGSQETRREARWIGEQE